MNLISFGFSCEGAVHKPAIHTAAIAIFVAFALSTGSLTALKAIFALARQTSALLLSLPSSVSRDGPDGMLRTSEIRLKSAFKSSEAVLRCNDRSVSMPS